MKTKDKYKMSLIRTAPGQTPTIFPLVLPSPLATEVRTSQAGGRQVHSRPWPAVHLSNLPLVVPLLVADGPEDFLDF